MLSRRKVIRTQDVKMDDNLLYHPSDLDIRVVLREQADQLIEILDLLEYEDIEIAEDEDLLNTVSDSLDSTRISTPSSIDVEELLEEQLR